MPTPAKKLVAAAVVAAGASVAALTTVLVWRRRRLSDCRDGHSEEVRPSVAHDASASAAASAAPDAETHAAAGAPTSASRSLEELFEEVRKRSKGILYVVSNKTNSAFSAGNLAKYLRQKGITPREGGTEDTTLANAALLVELLERTGDACRSLASTLRHELVRQAISPDNLQSLFPAMKAAYVQQPLDYGRNSRYGSKWRISCYLVVMENWKPKIYPHEPMVKCMGQVMDECVDALAAWYCKLKRLSSIEASVMNCFVTRYRPTQDEDQLEKHIDGANVDGSVVLALPTDDPCEGGALHVWDGKPQKEFCYSMKPGDILFMDNAVWHQAKPISTGTRWALVIFIRLRNAKPAAATAASDRKPDTTRVEAASAA
mmetsp:Transcript_91984/g.173300  ORF Transcript_91984/g.173300 Transcript_91984/m.173300 type:complete len:374 (-) Transcript_91984:48-1169(-)